MTSPLLSKGDTSDRSERDWVRELNGEAMARRWIRHLLDDSRLDGEWESTTGVRPKRLGFTVADESMNELYERISQLCQIWGGASMPLIPINGANQVDGLYLPFLPSETVDTYSSLEFVDGTIQPRDYGWSAPLDGHFHAAAFARFADRRGSLPSLRVGLPHTDSPWYWIYLVMLGTLPDLIDHAFSDRSRYRSNLSWSDFVEIDKSPWEGSLEEPTAMNAPRRMSAMTIPISKTFCWYILGTANALITSKKTKRLSIDSAFSVR